MFNCEWWNSGVVRCRIDWMNGIQSRKWLFPNVELLLFRVRLIVSYYFRFYSVQIAIIFVLLIFCVCVIVIEFFVVLINYFFFLLETPKILTLVIIIVKIKIIILLFCLRMKRRETNKCKCLNQNRLNCCIKQCFNIEFTVKVTIYYYIYILWLRHVIQWFSTFDSIQFINSFFLSSPPSLFNIILSIYIYIYYNRKKKFASSNIFILYNNNNNNNIYIYLLLNNNVYFPQSRQYI